MKQETEAGHEFTLLAVRKAGPVAELSGAQLAVFRKDLDELLTTLSTRWPSLEIRIAGEEREEPEPVLACTVCGGPLELSQQYPDAGYLHRNASDDAHVPMPPGS